MIKFFNYINLDIKKPDFTGKDIVIYGRGITALYTLMDLKRINANVIGFTDSFAKNGESFAGMKVYEVRALKDIENLVIYIAVNNESFKREILYNLESLCIQNAVVVCRGAISGAGEYNIEIMQKMIQENQDKINFIMSNLCDEKSKLTFGNLLKYRVTNDRELVESVWETSHKQYFPTDGMLKVCDNEVFVDVGGFDGKSTLDFIEWTDGCYSKSVILEADNTMFDICSEMMRVNHVQNAVVIKKAAWSHSTMLDFDNTCCLMGAGLVNPNGSTKVEAVSIDELLGEERATFIKMDVEGAEKEALIGAKKQIENNHPKLAISIYHKDDDLWEIPYDLMRQYPFYKFYIRHYTPYTTETILYATDQL